MYYKTFVTLGLAWIVLCVLAIAGVGWAAAIVAGGSGYTVTRDIIKVVRKRNNAWE